MANVPISNMTATWTDSGTTYNAIKMNVTDTASNAASLLMDLQVGGVSKFNVAKIGSITFAGHRMYSDANAICFTNSSNVTTLISRTDFTLVPQAAFIGWGNPANFASDLSLFRDAANTLAQRNATNAQTFRVYNTYTSLTNRENIRIAAASNVFYIEPEKGSGGGTLRPLVVGHGATTYAALPAASAALEGARAYVSDWTGAATFGTTVNAGGGTTKVPVWCDGTNWLVG